MLTTPLIIVCSIVLRDYMIYASSRERLRLIEIVCRGHLAIEGIAYIN